MLRATGWMLDDDGTGNDLALFVSRPVVVETDAGETQASFEVSLSRPAPEDFTVSYNTVDGSAVAGEDYMATSGTLSFVEGTDLGGGHGACVRRYQGRADRDSSRWTSRSRRRWQLSRSARRRSSTTTLAARASPRQSQARPRTSRGPTNTSDPNSLSWTVSLDAPASSAVTVGYRLLAGTGRWGRRTVCRTSTDLVLREHHDLCGRRDLEDGRYRIDADNIDEVDEAVVLEVFNPSGAALAGDAPVLRATGWMLDDDGTGNDLALFVSRPGRGGDRRGRDARLPSKSRCRGRRRRTSRSATIPSTARRWRARTTWRPAAR